MIPPFSSESPQLSHPVIKLSLLSMPIAQDPNLDIIFNDASLSPGWTYSLNPISRLTSFISDS